MTRYFLLGLALLQSLFLALRLSGTDSWRWFAVLIPLECAVVIVVSAIVAALLFLALTAAKAQHGEWAEVVPPSRHEPEIPQRKESP